MVKKIENKWKKLLESTDWSVFDKKVEIKSLISDIDNLDKKKVSRLEMVLSHHIIEVKMKRDEEISRLSQKRRELLMSGRLTRKRRKDIDKEILKLKRVCTKQMRPLNKIRTKLNRIKGKK